MSNKTITSAAAILGAALVGSLTAVNVASAAENPFAAKSLSSGYMQLAEAEGKEMKEGKCGEGKEMKEGKCGEGKEMKEGKCGEGKEMKEGKCGEGKEMKEGKCGEGKEMKEGKCGEGKCGGAK
jgi:uncharacterized low-complexity protein